jgi:DNA-binding transcriptional LysR family regulator
VDKSAFGNNTFHASERIVLVDNLTEISIFVRVVESGSFSTAAEKLGLSRAAVSKSVSRLENRLGARLLHRTTRRLSLTEAGRALFSRGREALATIEEAQLEVGHLQGEPRGTLRISGPVFFGVRYLAPVLAEFLSRYPAIEAEVELDDRVVDIIEEGFDVAIRITELPDSSLVTRRLARCRHVICASPEYWQHHGKPTRPEELAGHNCFIYSYEPSPRTWRLLCPDGREVAVQVDGRLRFNNTELARVAAVRGLGVILLPTFYVGEDIREGRLVSVLEDHRFARDVAVYAVYPVRKHLPPKVRLFVDLLVERFGPEPYWDALSRS